MAVAAEVVVEAAVEAKGQVEEVKTVVKIAEVRVKQGVGINQVRGQVRATPGTRPPGMRTCRRSRPACATGLMANRHIFVWSQPLAPGKIILSLNPIIKPENLTSSAKKKIYKI